MLYNLVKIFNNECAEEVEEEIEIKNKKEKEIENEKKPKKKSHKHRLPTFVNDIVKVPAIIIYHGRELTIRLSNYMIERGEKIIMLLEKIKEKIKKYQIPKIAPNYIELIFRNDSKLSTAGGLPDDGTITEEK